MLKVYFDSKILMVKSNYQSSLEIHRILYQMKYVENLSLKTVLLLEMKGLNKYSDKTEILKYNHKR